MLTEIFGPAILTTMFHNNKSPNTEPTDTLLATVQDNYNGKTLSVPTQCGETRAEAQERQKAKHPKLII